MTKAAFNQLVDFVVSTGLLPPAVLFRQGYEDWYTRASLAKFLCHPAYNHIDDAISLLESVKDIQVDKPEEIEQKAWALKQLGFLLRRFKQDFSRALAHITEAIRLAESTDHKYHVISRGDLWAERWIILNKLRQTPTALREADQKIRQFSFAFTQNNSYLYNAYRFKAQAAGAQGNVSEFLRLMKKALSFIYLNDQEKQKLAICFSAKHRNIQLLLNGIDLATPKKIVWGI